jgi:hypothetical protein
MSHPFTTGPRGKGGIEAHLGIESILSGSDWSTPWTLAYPLDVRVFFSMASQIAHPCSRHRTSPVVRHIMNMLSSVYTRMDRNQR